MYTGIVHVSYQNSYGKVLKNGWVQVDPLVCANRSEKYMPEQQNAYHRSARNIALKRLMYMDLALYYGATVI